MATGLDDFTRSLRKAVFEVTKTQNMKKIAVLLAARVKRRSQLGFSVAANLQRQKRFKALSPTYKKFRQGKIAFFRKGGVVVPFVPKEKPPLSSKTSPGKSNLTLTGQLLESIIGRSPRRGVAVVRTSGNRKNVGFIRTGRMGNKQLAKIVTEQGRPFLAISGPEFVFISREFQKLLTVTLLRNQILSTQTSV